MTWVTVKNLLLIFVGKDNKKVQYFVYGKLQKTAELRVSHFRTKLDCQTSVQTHGCGSSLVSVSDSAYGE